MNLQLLQVNKQKFVALERIVAISQQMEADCGLNEESFPASIARYKILRIL